MELVAVATSELFRKIHANAAMSRRVAMGLAHPSAEMGGAVEASRRPHPHKNTNSELGEGGETRYDSCCSLVLLTAASIAEQVR